MQDLSTVQVIDGFSNLNHLKQQAKNNLPNSNKQVATQFESLFLERILASARNTNSAMNDDEMNSEQMQFAAELLDKQLAQVLASKGLGIAEMLTKEINYKSV